MLQIYAKLTASDKKKAEEANLDQKDGGGEDENGDNPKENLDRKPPRQKQRIALMDGERELTTGLLSKETNFRLIVTGRVGVKEIERLIAKLELDKEILAEVDEPQKV